MGSDKKDPFSVYEYATSVVCTKNGPFMSDRVHQKRLIPFSLHVRILKFFEIVSS